MRAVIALLCAVLGLGLPSANSGPRISDVTVGTDCNFAPMAFKNADGMLLGYEIDLLREIGKQKNVYFRFVCVDWDILPQALVHNEIDMVAASTSITYERLKKFSFSKPYIMNQGFIIVRKFSKYTATLFDQSGNLTPDNWLGLRFGVLENTTHYNWAVKHVPLATLVLYRGFEREYDDLSQGKVDAVFSDYVQAQDFMNRPDSKALFAYAGPSLVDKETLGNGVGFMFKKTKLALRDFIDQSLTELVVSGKLDEIGLNYFISKPSNGLE